MLPMCIMATAQTKGVTGRSLQDSKEASFPSHHQWTSMADITEESVLLAY